MRRIVGAAVALAIMISMTLIVSAKTGYIEVRGHIVGIHHITYHANGGDGRHVGPNVSGGSADTVCSQSETGITRSGGYRFAGWNTRENGRGTSYAAGESIILTSNITLYAQWKEKRRGSPIEEIDNTIVINDDAVPTADIGITSIGTSAPNPYTGAVSKMPLCIGLLCISLAVMIFLIWAKRRKKPIDAQEL